MSSNTVYLGNVLSQCKEDDLYQLFVQFGQIKRIQIFCETFQGNDYPVGYALIEYQNSSGYQECIDNKQQIQYKTTLLHIHHQKPDTKFGLCIFIFFNDEKITREFLLEYFENFRPTDARVKNEVEANRLGFAIVEFPTNDSKEIALSFANDAPFTIVAPSQQLIDLSYDGSSSRIMRFKPDPSPFINNTKFKRFFDLEIMHNFIPFAVNRFLASAFSSRVHHLLLSNSILTRIETRIEAEGDFELIASVLTGQQIEVTKENAYFVFLMACDLGIEFLIQAASEFILATMTPERTIELASTLTKIGQFNGPHIQFMASNFDKMRNMREFEALPIGVIAAVLHHPQLKITDMEVFCNWLTTFIFKDPTERMRLLQFIKFDTQSRTIVKNLLENEAVNINLIRTPLLRMLHTGLSQRQASEVEIIDCRQKMDKPDDGVFKMMYDRCSGNPVDFNMVKITSNSTLHNIIENDWTQWWSTPSEQGSWIEFDFKTFKLLPTRYTLKTIVADVKLPYMKSWRIDGSDDEIHWDVLDEQRNSNTGNESKAFHTWEIVSSRSYRYIRLTQTDKNGSDNHCLFIHGIEFFGTLTGENMKEVRAYDPSRSNDWDGIFSFLKQRCNNINPVKKGVIDIKSSCDPKFLLGQNWSGCWRSPKEPRSWVQIELVNTELILTSYSLKTHYGPAYIKSWDVEVSKDGKTWFTVDSKVNRDEYKEPWANIHWACTQPQPDPMKFIKFTMTGPSSRDENIFWLSHIELFGDIFRHR